MVLDLSFSNYLMAWQIIAHSFFLYQIHTLDAFGQLLRSALNRIARALIYQWNITLIGTNIIQLFLDFRNFFQLNALFWWNQRDDGIFTSTTFRSVSALTGIPSLNWFLFFFCANAPKYGRRIVTSAEMLWFSYHGTLVNHWHNFATCK